MPVLQVTVTPAQAQAGQLYGDGRTWRAGDDSGKGWVRKLAGGDA